MKARTETRGKEPGRSWLLIPVWAIAVLLSLILIYVSGAVAARVLYMKGVLRDGSRSLSVVEAFYTPLHSIYSDNPTFKAGFDWCVAIFVPSQKDAK